MNQWIDLSSSCNNVQTEYIGCGKKVSSKEFLHWPSNSFAFRYEILPIINASLMYRVVSVATKHLKLSEIYKHLACFLHFKKVLYKAKNNVIQMTS